jgi:biopolymer transport protein ExbD
VKTLPDDAALKTALTALAQQKPRPRIRLTGSPDVPFDKVKHVIEIMGASGFDAGLGLVTQTAR